MKNPFKQKRCKQCGWELGIFSRQKFCSEQCVSIWDRDNKEREDLKRKIRTGSDKIKLSDEQLDRILDRVDENSKKYVEIIKDQQ